MAYKVDMMMGLCDDLNRAFTPALYLGMRHTNFGYPEEWPEKAATVQVRSSLRPLMSM